MAAAPVETGKPEPKTHRILGLVVHGVGEETVGSTLRLFFNNSWHGEGHNFYVRGGLFVLKACERLYRDGVNKGWIRE